MTVLDETLAEIRADAGAIEHAMHEGRLTPRGIRLAGTEVVLEIAISNCQASGVPGGLPALVAADYADDPLAFCARMRTALCLSAQLHGATALLPMLTATNLVLLPAVRVGAGWAVLETGVWRRVAAQPELVGDGDDEDGGGVELLLEGRGPVTYRRGEKVWARDAATHTAALEAAGEDPDA